MRDPRWIEVMLQTIIRMIGAAHFTRATLASFGALLMAAWLVQWQPAPWPTISIATTSEARLPLSDSMAADTQGVDEFNKVATHTRLDAPKPAPKLNKEQINLARFIARRYQVALEDTQLFVDGAYKAARENKIDPWLILAVMAVESSFNPDAASHKGAHGLMQVLTGVHADKFAPFGGVAAAFDPIANIRVGTRILREYISRDGSIENALKSYVGAAFLTGDSGYGNKVLEERERLAAAAAGKPMPEQVAAAAAAAAASAAPARAAGEPAIAAPTAVVAEEIRTVASDLRWVAVKPAETVAQDTGVHVVRPAGDRTDPEF